MEKCSLCDQPSALQNSHLIPSFVGAWLKKTSVTGYLRQAVSPNIRRQDIIKTKLLCRECENKLSVNEDIFKTNIFQPYTEVELDNWAIAQSKIKEFKYEKWLLDFVIGLQWRVLVTHDEIEPIGSENPKIIEGYRKLISSELSNWKDYLMGRRSDTGNSRHYLIFLQNLVSGSGTLPSRMHKKINTYLIRSVDSTLAISNTHLFLYTKMGPVLIISALRPSEFGNMDMALIKRKGTIRTAQNLKNKYVNEFIFISRPKEAFSQSQMSEVQKNKIAVAIQEKLKGRPNLQEAYISKSDAILQKRIEQSKI